MFSSSSFIFSGLMFRSLIHFEFIFVFPDGSEVTMSACNVGDLGSIPGSGRSPGEGNGNPLQCSCLENPRDRGAWWAAAYGVAQSRTRLKRLSSSSSSSSIACLSVSFLQQLASPRLVVQRLKRLPAMWETWVLSLGWEDPLEKETATLSSTLAWKIAWMEEPGGLQSMGLQRVGYG